MDLVETTRDHQLYTVDIGMAIGHWGTLSRDSDTRATRARTHQEDTVWRHASKGGAVVAALVLLGRLTFHDKSTRLYGVTQFSRKV